ncbi:alpha/beta hydrolase [Geoalkalibacter halelectricus]|uniref:alpha/beta hydrolase n=1 Tax=Geoalkalibacter halelectricus TaxID=2847045 RepID=UPI00266F3C0C|nr:alpha/beta hydrolase [Geoalkalibacter halelectricus]MDO3377609.1 alpha/beta hydrolase [Geoalkalibacter halelectricus]
MRNPFVQRLRFGPAALLLLVLLAPAPTEAALEHTFLFFPTAQILWTPDQRGLPYEDVWLDTEDGVRVHAWFVPGRADDDLPALLFFHGNAGNISHRVHNLELLHHRLGLPVLILSYRGYGQSQGRAGEQGLYKDARAAQAWLEQRGYGAERQIYFGRSIGAAVALQLAVERPPAGLILESPFTSIADMGRHHYRFLYALLGWMVDARFDNRSKIDAIRSPLMIIHGQRDNIVPPRMGEELHDLAPEPKKLVWLPRAGHNDTLDANPDIYWDAWREFLDTLATNR